MSLGSWFRDYVYIPMGGNRVSRLKWIRNILVVWFLTGFWHGAQWNFIFWGLYFAVLLIAEKYLKGLLDRLPSVIRHLYVAFFILISFALFNANSLAETAQTLGGMFGFTEKTLINDEAIYYAGSYIGIFALAIIGATPIPAILADRLCRKDFGRRMVNLIKPLLIAILLLIVTGYLIDGSFNPFLYFRF